MNEIDRYYALEADFVKLREENFKLQDEVNAANILRQELAKALEFDYIPSDISLVAVVGSLFKRSNLRRTA